MTDKDPPDQALAPTIANTPAEAPTLALRSPLTGPIVENAGELAAQPPPVGLGFEDRYTGGELLGAGGMGEVRQFEDTVIGRPVAIKFLRSEHAEALEARARFIREARVQGKLQHPSVVPVYELASTEAGATYFTMKRLGGRTLAEILERSRRGDEIDGADTHQLLTAFADVCLAVDYAHSRGVVHRDLKPANIMLGDFGEVYVLDWGLARLADSDIDDGGDDDGGGGDPDDSQVISEAVGVTSSQTVMGTVGYMAPEQLRGEPLDARADVYALGTILFEILSLEQLHAGPSNEARVWSTLDGADGHLRERARAHALAPELEALCLDATAGDRDERIDSCRELYERLEGYLSGDRDHARRVALATELASDAAAEAAQALRDDDIAARQRAMVAASRALALDPDQREAPAILVRLLMSPPADTPEEVRESLRESRRQKGRTQAKLAVLGYLSWLVAAPLFMWMGVTDWALGVAMIAAVLLCAGIAAIKVYSDQPAGPLLVASLLANAGALFLTTRLFGPVMLTPVLAMVTAITYTLYGHRLASIGAPLTACLAVAGAVVAESVGWLGESYQFAGGQLAIRSAVLDLRPAPTLITLTILVCASVVVACWYIGTIRRNLDAKEKQAQVLLWQYQQLVATRPAPASS